MKFLTNFTGLLVLAEDGRADDVLGVGVEVVEGDTGYGTSDTGSDVLAAVSDEVLNLEELLVILKAGLIELEVPVVGELERQLSMIGGFNLDDIGHEIWSKRHCNGLDLTLTLGGTTGERHQCELLVGLEKNKTWAENDSVLVLLVVIELDNVVLGDSI